MANKLKYRQDFELYIHGSQYRLTCYYQSTRTGFRHLCFYTSMCKDEPNTKDCIAKCVYYNRTWEEYLYKSVLTEAVGKLLDDLKYNITKNSMDTVRRVL